jgi:hypothetical protein
MKELIITIVSKSSREERKNNNSVELREEW